MTDGQVFYFAALAAVLLAAIVEHLWARRKRQCPNQCPPDAPWHCECRAKDKP